ncbi:hypothetical protein JAAARDRAFT_46446 [Jaapia argillacea MUCL 33604]|uniref:Uncharacterized protein n=1 Tax=Jaapia argillacea MUCL 33604 TaxID=933084 RepID=A0A067QB88_9AGAM|nr:hypothetical protein JAAARDRAFT_46446 [Jaapia argillacea MUCL 33604]
MGRKCKFPKLKEIWLKEQLPSYFHAQQSKRKNTELNRFWGSVQEGYYTKFPLLELTEAELTQVKGNKQLADVGRRNDKLGQIKWYFVNQTRPNSGSRKGGIDLAVRPKKLSLLTPSQAYLKLYHKEKLKDLIDERYREHVVAANPGAAEARVAFQTKVLTELLKDEPPENYYQQELRAWEGVNFDVDDLEEEENNQRVNLIQQNIDSLAHTITLASEQIHKDTGYSVHQGTTLLGHTWDEAQMDWSTVVHSNFTAHAHKCFPENLQRRYLRTKKDDDMDVDLDQEDNGQPRSSSEPSHAMSSTPPAGSDNPPPALSLPEVTANQQPPSTPVTPKPLAKSYEQERLDRIAENHKVLDALGMCQARDKLLGTLLFSKGQRVVPNPPRESSQDEGANLAQLTPSSPAETSTSKGDEHQYTLPGMSTTSPGDQTSVTPPTTPSSSLSNGDKMSVPLPSTNNKTSVPQPTTTNNPSSSAGATNPASSSAGATQSTPLTVKAPATNPTPFVVTVDHAAPLRDASGWKDLVEGWLVFKDSMGYPNNLNRYGKKYTGSCLPVVHDIFAFSVTWCKWWMSLQPEWRVQSDRLPFKQDPLPPDESWSKLARGGPNSISIVLMCLSWWLKGLGDSAGSNDEILAAITDITFIIQAMTKGVDTGTCGVKWKEPTSEEGAW